MRSPRANRESRRLLRRASLIARSHTRCSSPLKRSKRIWRAPIASSAYRGRVSSQPPCPPAEPISRGEHPGALRRRLAEPVPMADTTSDEGPDAASAAHWWTPLVTEDDETVTEENVGAPSWDRTSDQPSDEGVKPRER